MGRGSTERRWGGDHEPEMVGEATVRLVGAAGPHLHVTEALARQDGAESRADVPASVKCGTHAKVRRSSCAAVPSAAELAVHASATTSPSGVALMR